jgi:hypothetical protein
MSNILGLLNNNLSLDNTTSNSSGLNISPENNNLQIPMPPGLNIFPENNNLSIPMPPGLNISP